VRIETEDRAARIRDMSGSPVLEVRGQLIPLLFLNDVLGGERPGDDVGLNVLVLDAQGRRFGLVVDEVLDSEEIVVKPLCCCCERAGVLRVPCSATACGAHPRRARAQQPHVCTSLTRHPA
jgi:two-component system chemotaxis sensor kinase CheA